MHSLAWWPTLIVLAVATFTDLRDGRIPNWLVLPFLVAGIVLSPWRPDWGGSGLSFGWHGLGQSFAGMGLGLLVFGFLFWLGGMGGGDVKLCAALGAWIGPVQMFWALFFTSLAGGLMVLCWITYRMVIRKLILKAGNLFFGRKQNGMSGEPETSLAELLKRKMPYEPAIAMGTLVSFFAR
ncbi:MAG TPA: A24 family peptidase [Terracidiphilus sp.]|nr:A24 family peptidase [Terracidiphilus sp.]